jgi:DisA bacterial checkpoint controller nucleotide-binding
MPRTHAYPPDLGRYVEALWPSATPLTLEPELLEEALSTAFQASLTTEEARPTRFRLLLTAPDSLPESGVPNRGVLRLKLERSRPLNADELRRLAPAVPFETALIAAWPEGGKLRIWGVAHSGPAWLAPTWGGRSIVPNWTYDPIIHVTAPGKLAVRCAGKLIGAIERGLLVDAALDAFDSSWLPALFAQEREDVRAQHAASQASTSSPTHAEHSLVGKVGQHLLRRTIQLVRDQHHGGLLLFVAVPSTQPATPPRGLRLKYAIGQDEPSHRYRTLLLRIWEAVAATTSKASVGWADFAHNESQHLTSLEQEVFELSRAMANLAAIDGALVLDKSFGILGFGAEVSAELPSPERVFRALDTEGNERQPEPVENVGTRHRAAYRFVTDNPDGLAVVISQDGGVTFVANREGAVVFWEQSVSP